MIWIGIDPGKKGCLAFINKLPHPPRPQIGFLDWPKDDDLDKYFSILNSISRQEVTIAILERVHAMPKQGVSSMFTFGTNFGIWQGFLTALKWPYQLMAPQVWMKGVVAKADGPDAKSRIFNVAKRLYPNAELTGPKGGIKDGRADALMMARYAMLNYR